MSLKSALNDGRGALDAWLEVNDEAEVRMAINALIAEVVATEREACAQICDPYTHGQWFAKRIRARGQK